MRILLTSIVAMFCLLQCSDSKYKDGQSLYENNCSHCHMNDGAGLGDAIPALTRENLSLRKAQIPCIIKQGIKGKMMVMPPHPNLNEVEISNIVHYIFDQMADTTIQWSIADIKASLDGCED